MTTAPILWVALVIATLILVGILGPFFLRKAAPALARVPRLAVALLLSGILIWPTTLLAIGPVLAWILSGPAVFSAGVSDVCQQCLTASNPFTAATTFDTLIPSVVLIAIPVVAGAAITIGVATEYLARNRRSRHAAAAVFEGSTWQIIHGYGVSLVTDDRPWALAFSPRQGGIALSTGALERLEDDELAAVLTHEAAHLKQHHHLVSDLVASIARHLRWIPFIREAADSLPSYLEIAADLRARHHVGTPALVRALLVLGERGVPAGFNGPTAGALHAAGPSRIPHLVRPVTSRKGYLPAVVATAPLLILGTVSAVVFMSYAGALLNGCV